jgi:hypothetical protein
LICIARVIEAGSSILKLNIYMHRLYLEERNCIWKGVVENEFFDIEKYEGYLFSNEGLWLSLFEGGAYKTEYLDVFGSGKSFAKQQFYLGESGMSGSDDNLIGIKMRGERGVCLSDYSGEIKYFRAGRFHSHLVRNDHLCYVRDRKGQILCIDNELKDVWANEIDKRCFSIEIFQTPQLYKEKNLVIVNVGEKTDAERGEFELNAYNADNGDLVWQVMLEKTPCSSNLIGDKVYIIVLRQLIIVDASNGEILVNVKHGFRPFDAATSTYQGMVCPMVDSSNLICISPMDRKVQIRSSDASQVLQIINIPLPYMPSLTAPTEFEGSYYLPLQHIDSFNNEMKGGLLVFQVVFDTDGRIEKEIEASIAPRPPTLVELIKNESGDDVYQVSIEYDALKSNAASKTLDDLIRFSTIALKETAFKYGSYTSSTETNKNHHGRLLLSVKSGGLQKTTGLNDEELLEKLQVIKERVERNLADTGVQAGDGSNAFVVEIKLVE